MKLIAIVGASGHGKVVADLAEILGYQVAFFDDAYPEKSQVEHWPILGDTQSLIEQKHVYKNVVVAIGFNNIRRQKTQLLTAEGFNFPCLIHPDARVSRYSRVGDGSVVLSSAIINAFSLIGEGCIINTAAVIEHDCMIGGFSHICPKATVAGTCSFGEEVWFGVGSCTRQLIKIGDRSIIGAGSVVVKDIAIDVTAYGNPAKQVRGTTLKC
jgi:sugar O-acyltransferase (sialic acid O-acetyltransferase NeuD family)